MVGIVRLLMLPTEQLRIRGEDVAALPVVPEKTLSLGQRLT
jgi:hypothetical protein